MKHMKLCIVALLAAVVLIFTACGTAAPQDESVLPGESNMQAPASQEPTLAAQGEIQQGAVTQPTATQPAQQTTQKSSQPSAAGGVSLEKAKEIALNHAGFTASQVTFTKARRESDDGISKYAVEFVQGGWEYQYEIHAGTGVILESERKRTQEPEPTATPPSQSNAPGEISLEKAKEIALADAGFIAEQVRFKRARSDREHGVTIYEIEFEVDGREYAYEIHAGTGVILKSKGKRAADATQPSQTTQPAQSNSPGEIGLEKAKEIALADAGLTAAQVTFKKAKEERDGGIVKYEIKFVSGGREYEYKIHGSTGAILKRDKSD